MNDFTKEGLDLLDKLIKNPESRSAPPPIIKPRGLRKCLDPDLINKLRGIFENYCDHNEQYEDLDYNPMRCKSCLEITE